MKNLRPDTVTVAAGRPAPDHDAPVNPPIVLSSTYVGTGTVIDGDRAYGRYSNPSWDPLEEALSALEGASEPALLFSSGLAAASAALSLIPAGGTLVMPSHSYQGAFVMAQELQAKGLFTVRSVDIADTDQVLSALKGALTDPSKGSDANPTAATGQNAASMLWLETPTNPMLEVADIRALTRCATAVGALVVADNTFCTPLVQQPLQLGADVVLHSVTKYLSGHSDVILGALATSNPALRAQLHHHRSIHGAIAGPFEAWLALRGLRTLALRMDRAQESALELARRLHKHHAVERVLFPGLESDPGHERAKKQMTGFGAVLCIEILGGELGATKVVEALRLWTPATSLGGVESLIERRRRHANEPQSVPENLLRLSVGIENVEDLWDDLLQALNCS